MMGKEVLGIDAMLSLRYSSCLTYVGFYFPLISCKTDLIPEQKG